MLASLRHITMHGNIHICLYVFSYEDESTKRRKNMFWYFTGLHHCFSSLQHKNRLVVLRITHSSTYASSLPYVKKIRYDFVLVSLIIRVYLVKNNIFCDLNIKS